MREAVGSKAPGNGQDIFTHFVTALVIGNCVAGVWFAAGVAFAASLNGAAPRCDVEAR